MIVLASIALVEDNPAYGNVPTPGSGAVRHGDVRTRQLRKDATMNCEPQDRSVRRTRQLRAMAARVLRELLENRTRCEHHLAELGRSDAIKTITGCSSIDQAVKQTRAMIDQMDEILESVGADPEPIMIETPRRGELQPVHSAP